MWACCPNKAFLYALQKREAYYVFATYDAVKGSVISSSWYTLRVPFVPTGMAQSSTNVYVSNQQGSIAKGGDLYFINSTVKAPYALAVGGPIGKVQNVLYVINNAQNENGYFYISTYDADSGTLLTEYFIQIATGGLYGLALSKDNEILYVSVYNGIAPGVYTYNATTGAPLNGPGPFVSVNEPWGIAIGSPPLNGNDPTLYVASYQDSMIYEFDATNGGQPTGSIKVSAPTNITVEPANEQ